MLLFCYYLLPNVTEMLLKKMKLYTKCYFVPPFWENIWFFFFILYFYINWKVLLPLLYKYIQHWCYFLLFYSIIYIKKIDI
jgi:hypothetical protein